MSNNDLLCCSCNTRHHPGVECPGEVLMNSKEAIEVLKLLKITSVLCDGYNEKAPNSIDYAIKCIEQVNDTAILTKEEKDVLLKAQGYVKVNTGITNSCPICDAREREGSPSVEEMQLVIVNESLIDGGKK